MPSPAVIKIPEKNKKPGVCYAVGNDGIELPVIDVTHPAFACDVSPVELSALIDDSVRALVIVKATPPEQLREIAAKSILARGWAQSVGSFMSGMMTYLNRLGPANLGDGYASEIDRRMAAGLMALSFRFRLRDVARLIADALAADTRDDLPIYLLNIGGGPAADTLNGLILVNKERPKGLRNHPISIHVLDLDEEGPSFGSRALSALLETGAPLYGLDVKYQYTKYDWSDITQLRDLLAGFGKFGACVCSSEGGLFDYGSDGEIVANLTVLRENTPPQSVVVGSVVRDAASLDPRLRATTTPQGCPLIRYLGLDAFRLLAHQAGWNVDRVIDSVAHHAVSLKKRP